MTIERPCSCSAAPTRWLNQAAVSTSRRLSRRSAKSCLSSHASRSEWLSAAHLLLAGWLDKRTPVGSGSLEPVQAPHKRRRRRWARSRPIWVWKPSGGCRSGCGSVVAAEAAAAAAAGAAHYAPVALPLCVILIVDRYTTNILACCFPDLAA